MTRAPKSLLEELKRISADLLTNVSSEEDFVRKLNFIAIRCNAHYDCFEKKRYITLDKGKHWLEYELKDCGVVIYEMSPNGVCCWCIAQGEKTEWRTTKRLAEISDPDAKERLAKKSREREKKRKKQYAEKLRKRRIRQETIALRRNRLKAQREHEPETYTNSPSAKRTDFHQDIPSAQRSVDATKSCRMCANRGASVCPNGGLEVCELWLEKRDISGYWSK